MRESSKPRLEAFWDEITSSERQVVVDVRESSEIQPEEWDFFRSQGSQVVHSPWMQWNVSRPDWSPGTSYLLVCARGIRSLAALKTLPPEIAALSLAGGVFALDQSTR